MIPRANIIEWRTTGYPWETDAMVEQDLLISRMLVELFHNEDKLKLGGECNSFSRK